jgi:hypothetical protein
MVPLPKPLELHVCELVIEDAHTHNLTLVSMFTDRICERFPSDPVSFSVFCPLTDGNGRGTMMVEVSRFWTTRHAVRRRYPIEFPRRQSLVNVHIRLNNVRFPEPGLYNVSVAIDGELVAQKSINVRLREV